MGKLEQPANDGIEKNIMEVYEWRYTNKKKK